MYQCTCCLKQPNCPYVALRAFAISIIRKRFSVQSHPVWFYFFESVVLKPTAGMPDYRAENSRGSNFMPLVQSTLMSILRNCCGGSIMVDCCRRGLAYFCHTVALSQPLCHLNSAETVVVEIIQNTCSFVLSLLSFMTFIVKTWKYL